MKNRDYKKYYQEHREEISQRVKKYQIENKEKLSQYKKEYYHKNREMILQQAKEYYIKNKERISQRAKERYWADGHQRLKRSPLTPEEIRQYRYEWRQKNKDRINARRRELRALRKKDKKKTFAEIIGFKSTTPEYDRLYHLFNRERLLQQKKEYWNSRGKEIRKNYTEKNKDKLKKVYQARKNGLTIDIIQSIYEDNIKQYGTLTCEYCKNCVQFGDDTLDHIIPISRGGTNEKENLCIACKRCNFSKQAKLPEEFKKYQTKLEEVSNGQE